MARLRSSRVTKKRRLASPLGDTIEVKQKLATAATSYESHNAHPGPAQPKLAQQGNDVRLTLKRSNRPWGRKGKAPAQDHMRENLPVHDDDFVEEYEFTSDGEDLGAEDDSFDGDDRSVISLSSEDSEPLGNGPADRPWRIFGEQTREQWEMMYTNVTMHAMGANWEVTEDYQREKDIEMLRYIEDHPLPTWIIPQEQAEQAYFRLLERSRWRALGIRIYGRERIPEWMPGSTNAARTEQAIHNPRDLANGSVSSHEPSISAREQSMQASAPHRQSLPVPLDYAPGHVLQHTAPMGPSPGSHSLSGPSQYMHPGPPYDYPQMHTLPSGGPPVGLPQQLQYTLPPGYPGYYQTGGPPPADSTAFRKGRAKKETPPATTPPPPPPTPPYPSRERPVERKMQGKAGRRNLRKPAEAEEFPWSRKINFTEAKANARWDDGIYDPETMNAMEAVRTYNLPIIAKIDQHIHEQQREYRGRRAAKKRGDEEPTPVVEPPKERKKKEPRMRNDAGGDPYHSGCFTFATPEDEKKAAALDRATPDEIIEDATAGSVDLNIVADIKVTWNPGKKGQTHELRQAIFTVKDSVLTRKQLQNTPILTRRAAECIVDFCPDMLWRSMLLRITSEAGYGNKDVRDRFCYNGCYCDKATITKRISAALGQKQTQTKANGYHAGEWDWYDANVKDFSQYIDYFGKRTSHRNMLKIQIAGERRRAKAIAKVPGEEDEDEDEDENESSEVEGEKPTEKHAGRGQVAAGEEDSEAGEVGKLGVESEDDDNDDDAAEGESADVTGGIQDSVSVQDSDILDKMEED